MARSKKKVPYLHKETLLMDTTKSSLTFFTRNSLILPSFLKKKLYIYNGKRFSSVYVVPEMIGLKLGEFSFTRRTVTHKKKNRR